MNDYNQQIAARLSRLGAARCTGALPISGYSSGAIYLLDGRVIGAESSRTPVVADPGGTSLTRAVTIAESAIDAALDLLSSRSTCSRFRPTKVRPDTEAISVPVGGLLAEVARRRQLLRQMAGVTADLALARNPELPIGQVQLTCAEWALLVRVRPRATPRELAWTLRRSVFGTTVDVHRLMLLGLLRTADRQVQGTVSQKPGRRIRPSQRTAPSSPAASPFERPLSFGQALAGRGAAAKKTSAGD